FCSACDACGARPSIVTIFCVDFTLESGRTHERTGSPSMCTVQAPHCAMPQPYLVPVKPICSRSTHSSGVSGSAWKSWDLPLTFRRAIVGLLVRACGGDCGPLGVGDSIARILMAGVTRRCHATMRA